jgi:RNA-splicing ligase RtcB
MGEQAVILEGTEQGRDAMFSTVHGAGRALSRTQAAERMGQRAECSARDCDFWVSFKHYRHEREQRGSA